MPAPPLRSLAPKINAAYDASLRDANSALENARRCGALLLEAKEAAGHKGWLPWLAEQCPNIPARRAQKYMQLAGAPAIDGESVRGMLDRLTRSRPVANAPRGAHLDSVQKPRRPRRDAPEIDKSAAKVADDEGAPSAAEIAEAEASEVEYQGSIAKVMAADDKLAAAHAEIKRQAAEIASLKIARNGFMDGKAAVEKLLAAEQRKNARLIRRVRELESKAKKK